MTSIDEKIREYGQKQDVNALQQLMLNLSEEELINMVKSKINSAYFTYTWNYILQSFSDTIECHRKRFKMVHTVLKDLEENDMSASRRNTIINRLCIELTKFKSKHLAELCNFCLECIQSKKNTRLTCKDLLPELLNVLVEREKFEYNDSEYTGIEYKMDFMNSLCMTMWSPNKVTLLTSMFIDMPLTKEEHLKVVNKLGTYIEKMTPQEVPAFVYQLLKLCKQHNGRLIFFRLQTYFGIRIYNNANLSGNSSSDSNTNLDIIESADNQDTIDAESTVLYHIHTAASLGHDCVKDYLNSLKNILKSPEFVLHPFQLMVLLTISTIPHYEETVFDIIRPCIVRTYQEEQKKQHSCWFREMVPSTCKPEEVFSQVIHSGLQDRDLVIQGLVNFGFVLLGIGSGLGRDPIAEKQWNLGNIILLKIIKRKRHVAPTIIQTLCNNIVTKQNVSQYIECLYILSKNQPLLMLENQSCVVELMESLVQVPASIANPLLDALIPLAKISPTIRDHLIILLRKALYSRITGTRQMAVNGFLKLLKNLRTSNLVVLSQSSNSTGSFSSGHSLLTQISMNRSTQTVGSSVFSNEALCLEVLSILKRCFMQQMEVRTKLYEGLYDAVCMNSELGIPVLDLIWCHFSNYYIIDEDTLPPLNFDKIVTTRDAEPVLLEPLGKQVYVIGLIVIKVMESEEDKENQTTIKFVNILESLCQRMVKCDLGNFNLDESTDLLDDTPESQQKVYILNVAMSVYEALIGYKICSWTQQSENQAQAINSLFQGYKRLQHFSKNQFKPKKGDGKRKKVDNRMTQQSHASTTLKKDGQKASKQLKFDDTVLSFEPLKKILSLLHEPTVDWTTISEANIIKTKHDFHQHMMQVTLYLIQKAKQRKEVESRYKKLYYDHIMDVASILIHRIIKRLHEFLDFDCTTAVLAVDCFHSILVVMSTVYKSNFKQFMNKTVGNDAENGFINQLTALLKIYQKFLEMGEEVGDNIEIKKMLVTVVNTLSILTNQIPTESNISSIQMCEWLKNFSYNNTLSAKPSSVFINLFFETHIKYKVSLTIFEQISVSVGDIIGVITEEEHNVEKFEILNEGTVHNIILSLCNNIKSVLDDIDAVIVRLKSEYNNLTYPGVENVEKRMEHLKTKERGACCQICFVTIIMTNLCNITIHPGNVSEVIFKNIMVLYSTLTLLTKHFITRSSKVNLAFQGARFERLVKLAGKQLAPAVYRFIMHIEESQKKENQPTQSKKKNVNSSTLKSKVLRETRLIPKVIYELEQFSKSVILLSNRTKLDLAKYIGQGIVRDYRIMGLKEILEQAGDRNIPETQSTEAPEEEMEVDGSGVGEEHGIEEELGSPPLSKRSKR